MSCHTFCGRFSGPETRRRKVTVGREGVPGEEYRNGSWFSEKRYADAELEDRRLVGIPLAPDATVFPARMPENYVGRWEGLGDIWDACEAIGKLRDALAAAFVEACW